MSDVFFGWGRLLLAVSSWLTHSAVVRWLNFFPLAGPWDPEKDGSEKGDGTPDEAALIKTACRIVKEQADVDISGCTSWFKLLEVYYTRPVEVRSCWVPRPCLGVSQLSSRCTIQRPCVEQDPVTVTFQWPKTDLDRPQVLNGKVYPEEREQTLYIVPCLTKDMMPTEDAFTAQLVEIADEHVSQSPDS